jgi:hypothetical protein
VTWIASAPQVLSAFDPRHAVRFFVINHFTGFACSAPYFLSSPGGEALYADMGHFGKQPIRLAWFALVLPALVPQLPRTGRAAAAQSLSAAPLLRTRAVVGLLPLVGIATVAAVIASQAADLRLVFHHAPGDSARARSAPRGGAYVRARDRPDLCPAGELGADVRDRTNRHRIRIVGERSRRRTASPSR